MFEEVKKEETIEINPIAQNNKTIKTKRNYETFYVGNTKEEKEKKKEAKKEIKEKKDSILDDKFHDILFELRKEIYIRANSLDETNYEIKKIYINNLDFVENLSYKSIDDLKALSKILEYCKLYKVKPTEELVNAVDSLKLTLKMENKNE